ncbi:MAG: hypothetical protein A2485_14440 [Bdellovibrionales bacterium RIFOXYC12_FULL_39_17]|nr:MAG: hypothetical protein A2485_14440 [Bdellovibrionales bacterium RIFOXYC12_FULL_39_17]
MRQEILKIDNDETSIEITGNQINSIRQKTISKIGTQIFQDGKIYSASFVGNIDEDSLTNKARSNVDGAVPYNYDLNPVNDASTSNLLAIKNKDDFLLETTAALDYMVKNYPNFIFSGRATIAKRSVELNFKNEAHLSSHFHLADWNFLYKHKKSAAIIDGYLGGASVADFNILGIARNYSPYLDVFENIIPLKAQKLPVVFVSQADINLFKKIIESARADYYKKDVGLFKGKLGQKILSDKFSLYDISYDPTYLALEYFDAEGFIRNDPKLPLVKNGVFANIICDANNAKKYNLQTTGNAKRSFNRGTTLANNKIVIGHGTRDVQTILKGLPECIIAEFASGGDFTDSGDFATPVQNGFLARDGKIIGRLPQITLTSSVNSMFGNDLLEVAKDAISPLAQVY